MNPNDFIDAVIRDVSELPDRNSPPDEPEMMLVTAKELRQIIEARLEDVGLIAIAEEVLAEENPTQAMN